MGESTINERVNFLVETLEGGNKLGFAKKIGSKSGTIGDLTGGRLNKPSFKMLVNIKEAYPFVNIEWVVTGKGDWNLENVLADARMMRVEYSKQITQGKQMPKVVVVDPQNRNRTVLIGASQRARAGYLAGHGDPEYMGELPSYDLPGLYKGTYRMFEVDGHSMAPTLHSKDIVVAEWVEDLADMRDERIYVLVTRDGVVIKRCLNRVKQYGYIIAKSDNITKIGVRPEYENLHIYPQDIFEIWYSRLYVSHTFHAPSDTYNRISNTEAELENLILQLKKKGVL